MDQIIQINIAGTIISVHESAYEPLREYINSLRKLYSPLPNGIQTIYELENNIVENLNQKISASKLFITTEDVMEMIQKIGTIEQQSNNFFAYNQNKNQSNQPKKLYKINNKKAVGGVCAGIAEYFNIDTILVRLGFIFFTLSYGIGVFLYIALWIFLPSKDLSNIQNNRRLFRLKERKVIGGVCMGISKLTNTDVVWIRLLFTSPLLLLIFFNIINMNSGIINLIEGTIPTSFLLYITLWIAVPLAKTPEDIKQLNSSHSSINLLTNSTQTTSQIKENNTLNSILKVFLLIMLGMILLSFIGINLGILGAFIGLNTDTIFDGKSIFQYLIIDSDIEPIFWTSIIAIGLIPAIFIVMLMRRIIIGPKKDSAYNWMKILPFIFVAGIFGFIYSTKNILHQFNHKNVQVKEACFIKPDNDSLQIKAIKNSDSILSQKWKYSNDFLFQILSDNSIFIKNVTFNLLPSHDDSLRVLTEYSSYGIDESIAKNHVNKSNFDWSYNNTEMNFANGVILSKEEPFRFQNVNVKIEIPQKVKFKISPELLKYNYKNFTFFNKRFKIQSGFKEDWKEENWYYFENDTIQYDVINKSQDY